VEFSPAPLQAFRIQTVHRVSIEQYYKEKSEVVSLVSYPIVSLIRGQHCLKCETSNAYPLLFSWDNCGDVLALSLLSVHLVNIVTSDEEVQREDLGKDATTRFNPWKSSRASAILLLLLLLCSINSFTSPIHSLQWGQKRWKLCWLHLDRRFQDRGKRRHKSVLSVPQYWSYFYEYTFHHHLQIPSSFFESVTHVIPTRCCPLLSVLEEANRARRNALFS
jgi:hypothetical protein